MGHGAVRSRTRLLLLSAKWRERRPRTASARSAVAIVSWPLCTDAQHIIIHQRGGSGFTTACPGVWRLRKSNSGSHEGKVPYSVIVVGAAHIYGPYRDRRSAAHKH